MKQKRAKPRPVLWVVVDREGYKREASNNRAEVVEAADTRNARGSPDYAPYRVVRYVPATRVPSGETDEKARN